MKTFIASSLSLSNINAVFKISAAGYRITRIDTEMAGFFPLIRSVRAIHGKVLLLEDRENKSVPYRSFILSAEKLSTAGTEIKRFLLIAVGKCDHPAVPVALHIGGTVSGVVQVDRATVNFASASCVDGDFTGLI